MREFSGTHCIVLLWGSVAAPGVRPRTAPISREVVVMVVNRFGEADPDVEQPEPAAEPAEKAVGYQGPQVGITQQEGVVGPLGGPGKNNQQHSRGSTDKHEQQHQQTMKPDLPPRETFGSRGLVHRYDVRLRLGSEPRSSRQATSLRRGGVRHQAGLRREKGNGDFGKETRSAVIQTFYDFRARMRSPTSR